MFGCFLSVRDKFVIPQAVCRSGLRRVSGQASKQNIHSPFQGAAARGLLGNMKKERQALEGTVCIKFKNCVCEISVASKGLEYALRPTEREIDKQRGYTLVQHLCAFVSEWDEGDCHGKNGINANTQLYLMAHTASVQLGPITQGKSATIFRLFLFLNINQANAPCLIHRYMR